MNYAALLGGRPFGAGVSMPTNPYEQMLRQYVSMAEEFKLRAPEITRQGTPSRPAVSRKPMASLTRDEYRRPAPPTPELFGGY